MKSNSWQIITGIGLLFLGALFLLDNLNLISIGETLWGLLFAIGGLCFIYVVFRDYRKNWWALIPGCVLFGLGLLISMQFYFHTLANMIGGSIFLGSVSLSFWLIYLLDRDRWWAIIPGGVVATLAVIAGISDFAGFDSGIIFFLGLSLTFVLVALLPPATNNRNWAWIPAAILFGIGALVSLGNTQYAQFIWPVGLIAAGGFMVLRSFLKHPTSVEQTDNRSINHE